jgi:hypothetical protein
MSDQRKQVRRIIDEMADKIKVDLPQRKNDQVFQQALIDLRDSPEFEEVITKLGFKLEFMPNFAANARSGYELERAIARIMHTAASAHADRYCQTVSAKMIGVTRAIVEKDLGQPEQPLTPAQKEFAVWFLA